MQWPQGAALLALGIAAPAWYATGRLAQLLRLPLITGYLLAGVLSGPYSLGLMRTEFSSALRGLDHACLGLIALAAGAELHLAELNRTRRQVMAITVGVAVVSWAAVFAAVLAAAPSVPFLAALPGRQAGAVASLAATLAMARSPASAIAVVRETDGKGPFCSLVMAVVVVKDVLVFICFAVNVEFARSVMHGGGGMSARNIAEPLASLAMSLAVGVGGGALLGVLLTLTTGPALASAKRRISTPMAARLRGIVMLALCAATFELTQRLGAEPLLACVTSGLIAANRGRTTAEDGTGGGGSGGVAGREGHEAADPLALALGQLMPVVNVVFFGLIGASIRLDALVGSLGVAALVCLVRLAGVYIGSWLGCWAGATAPDLRKKVWRGMVTQAGVAMGLAKAVATRFPGVGQDFASFMLAIILMNLLAGPPLFKSAIVALGEARGMTTDRKDKAAQEPEAAAVP